MEKKNRNRVSFVKLCSYEKAIVRSICVFVALLVASTAFSGFCSVKINQSEPTQIESKTIDFAASAENTATFRNQYNTLQTGTGNIIVSPETIRDSKEAIGDAVENMYSAAVSLSFQKSKMMEDAEGAAVEETTALTEVLTAPVYTAVETEPEPETQMSVTAAQTQTPTQAPATEPAPPEESDPEEVAQPDQAYTAAASIQTISIKTPPATLFLDENGVPTNYKKVISGNASAYSGDGRTATGTVPVPGSIAVNPKIIPYGTKMWIVSSDGRYVYGYAEAEDTGGFINWSNAPIADLFFDSESACNAFGRRNITIYILE